MDNATEMATQIVDLIQSQNWKNGGVLTIDRNDAIDLVAQALRTAYSAGSAAGTREAGESMLRAFDETVRLAKPTADQQEYLDSITQQAAQPVDLTKVIGGPR